MTHCARALHIRLQGGLSLRRPSLWVILRADCAWGVSRHVHTVSSLHHTRALSNRLGRPAQCNNGAESYAVAYAPGPGPAASLRTRSRAKKRGRIPCQLIQLGRALAPRDGAHRAWRARVPNRGSRNEKPAAAHHVGFAAFHGGRAQLCICGLAERVRAPNRASLRGHSDRHAGVRAQCNLPAPARSTQARARAWSRVRLTRHARVPRSIQ